jgi:hypothetical protein
MMQDFGITQAPMQEMLLIAITVLKNSNSLL